MSNSANPSVFDYVDYRMFLRDFVGAHRRSSAAFSFEALCRRAQHLTKGHLSLIISGRRNLTAAKLDGLVTALNLSGGERTYFRQLVGYNQARSTGEKELHLEAMLSASPKRRPGALRLDQYAVLESWHGLVIRELARLPHFSEDPKIVAHRLKGRLTTLEASRALKLLFDTGLLVRAADGQIVPSDEPLVTSDELASLAVRRYHKSCLDLGKQALEMDPVGSREFASVNVVVTPPTHALIKQKIKKLRDEILELQRSGTDDGAQVCQLNIQFFSMNE